MDKMFSPNTSLDIDATRVIEKDLINRLRIQSGLAHHNFKTRNLASNQVLQNPGRMQITGTKVSGDFVRLNLNSGDSWGYFYPIKSPEVVFNFKGEHDLSLRDINSEFYTKAKKTAMRQIRFECLKHAKNSELERHDQAKRLGERFYLAFRDERTDTYYVGYHDFSNNENSFTTVSSKDKINDYLEQHSVEELPEIIETWKFDFDPYDMINFDYLSRTVNSFEPSQYLVNATNIFASSIPPNIELLIRHAIGPDKAMFDHFINWLAYIFQNRTRTQTAWVLQGVSGTGKGILFNQIIRPLLGRKQCQSLNLENFEEQFNKSFETCLFAFIDEVDTNQMKNRDKVVAKLKTNITEPTIGIHAMHRDLREAPSHINFMMASNRHNSMRIDGNDRRFNVCQRQEKSLRQKYSDIPALLRSIESELQDFADFLYSYAVDVDMVRTPIENSAKKLLAGTTQTSSEAVATALLQGDLEFLMEHRPDRKAYYTCKFDGNAYFAPSERYLEIIETATQKASSNQTQVLDHTDLFAIFELLVGKMPSTKIKLGKLVGHQGIEIKGHTSQGRSVRGCKVKWRTTKNKRAKWRLQIEQEKETAKTKSIEEQVQQRLSVLADKDTS